MKLVEFLNITETPDAFLQDFKGIREQLGKQGVDITITKLDDRTVEIDNIDVSPAFRGRGLGTKAMNALIALADKHNTRIFLYPLEDNEEDIDLQDWYGRLGFSHYADQVHGIYMLYDPSDNLSTNPMSESAIPQDRGNMIKFFTGVVSEEFLAEMNAGKDVDFRYDITGHHHGQDDGMVYAFNPETNGIYGQINWTSYQNETYINHIEVRPEFRRQGIARMMIEFLKKKNEEPLNWGMTTPEGTEFRKAIGDDDETR